jgi:hypothetical protein
MEMDGWKVGGWVVGWVGRWVDGVDGWMDGWMDGYSSLSITTRDRTVHSCCRSYLCVCAYF